MTIQLKSASRCQFSRDSPRSCGSVYRMETNWASRSASTFTSSSFHAQSRIGGEIFGCGDRLSFGAVPSFGVLQRKYVLSRSTSESTGRSMANDCQLGNDLASPMVSDDSERVTESVSPISQKGKGRRDFSQRPLFMPATTYSPTHFRVQYNRPSGA